MFWELVLRAENIGSDSDWAGGGARSATVKAGLATHCCSDHVPIVTDMSYDDENHHQKSAKQYIGVFAIAD